MITFPDISPVLFSINFGGFDLAIRWYALAYILGFLIAGLLMKFLLARPNLWRYGTPPLEQGQAETLITYLILGVILGGRLGYVLFYNFDFYLANPLAIIKLWDGGMSFHGGFLGVVISAIIYGRFHGIPLLMLGDLLAVATPPGLFLGRIANFINAELWGKPTVVMWGVVFPGPRAQDCPGVVGPCARHPSQIYEALLEGLILFFILFLLSVLGYLKRPGFLMGIFLAGYGLARYIVEFFRVPDPQFFSLENTMGYAITLGDFGLTMGQLLSLPMVLVGFLFIANSYGRKMV